MILAADLQAIIAGAKRPDSGARSTVRVTVYKTWNDKGKTMAVLGAAMGGGRMVCAEDILRDYPELKEVTVKKLFRRLARDGKVRRMVVLGRIYWTAAR